MNQISRAADINKKLSEMSDKIKNSSAKNLLSNQNMILFYEELKTSYDQNPDIKNAVTDLLFEEFDLKLSYLKEFEFFSGKTSIIKRGLKQKYLDTKTSKEKVDQTITNHIQSNKANLLNIINICDGILEEYSTLCVKSEPLVVSGKEMDSFYIVDLHSNNPINILNKYILEIHQIKFEIEKIAQEEESTNFSSICDEIEKELIEVIKPKLEKNSKKRKSLEKEINEIKEIKADIK